MSGTNDAISGITSDRIAQEAMRFVRERYPYKTADRVAFDIKVPVNTVAKWLCGASMPNATAMVKMIAVYGEDFLRAILPEEEWTARVALDAERHRLTEKRAAIDARIQELRA